MFCCVEGEYSQTQEDSTYCRTATSLIIELRRTSRLDVEPSSELDKRLTVRALNRSISERLNVSNTFAVRESSSKRRSLPIS
jgi:hypothetical protein